MRGPTRAAFSLVELSIVLVILGLLVGGVLGGQSLIKAAQLRNILTEKEKYVVAINAFQGKYNALPGDMSNATSYWTPAHATNSTCLTTARSGGTTCNGNGNGDISGVNSFTFETSLAWEHLTLAGLIEGRYIGFYTGLDGNQWPFYPTQTTPQGKLSGSTWFLHSGQNLQTYATAGTYNDWPGRYKHQLAFARYTPAVANEYTGGGIVPAEDAYNLDTKTDDGKPGTGTLRTQNYGTSAGDCSSSVTRADYATATYSLTSSAMGCKLYFDMGF